MRQSQLKLIRYRSQGLVGYFLLYLLDGKEHRVGGPSSILYRGDGTVEHEAWREHGVLHRLDGPSLIRYQDDGTVARQHWHVRGTWKRMWSPDGYVPPMDDEGG